MHQSGREKPAFHCKNGLVMKMVYCHGGVVVVDANIF